VCFLFRPDLIEYNKLTKANPVQSLNNAFNVADQKLGLTPLLDAEGKIVYIICNWKFCICIVSGCARATRHCALLSISLLKFETYIFVHI